MQHNLDAVIAYNDASVIAHFLVISACDWEFANKLTGPVIIGILAPPSDK